MKGWEPVPDYMCHITLFVIFGLLFLAFGITYLVFVVKIVEVRARYDDQPACVVGSACQLKITVPDDMEGPVFFYYELHNFYQNHRRYVNSRNVDQLKGKAVGSDEIEEDCESVTSMADTGRTVSYTG